jgi:drug/metabolite transporter (DMT)-like permease
MELFKHYLGEAAALSAAGIWAGSSIIYSNIGKNIAPLVLNLSKGAIAIVYLLITIAITGERITWQPTVWPLLLSGLIGIAWGDTVFFAALNRIGARQTLLINTISPVITALLASLYLSEQLAPLNYAGIGLAIAGVAGVISIQPQQTVQLPTHQYWSGVGYALLSAGANSIASILSRQAMLASNWSPISTTLIRLGAGTAGIVVLLLLWPALRRQAITAKIDWPTWLLLAATAFFSTYIGICLQQTAFKYTAAGIAQTIGATSPLFVLGFDLWRGEKVSWPSLGYALLTISGVSLLFAT